MDIKETIINNAESSLEGIVVDKMVEKQQSLTEAARRQLYLQFIKDNELQSADIKTVLYDYAFKLFIQYLGEAEYKIYKDTRTTMVQAGLKTLSGMSFLDAISDVRSKRYLLATAKINRFLHLMIALLEDEQIITEEEGKMLTENFTKESHTEYSIMPLTIGLDGHQEPFFRVLKYMDKNEVNLYFNKKYQNETLLRDPCKGDYYNLLMRTIEQKINVLFV